MIVSSEIKFFSQKYNLKQFDFSSIRFCILYSIINPQMDSDTTDHQNLNSYWSDDLPLLNHKTVYCIQYYVFGGAEEICLLSTISYTQ